jgi:hypothetical protein
MLSVFNLLIERKYSREEEYLQVLKTELFVNAIELKKVIFGTMVNEISGSHGGEYEDGCLVGCCAV